MIRNKKLLERQSFIDVKVGQMFTNLQMFFVNVTLKMSSSTVHDVIKTSENLEKSLWIKVRVKKSILNAPDLRALRWQCFKNTYGSVMEITAWKTSRDHCL